MGLHRDPNHGDLNAPQKQNFVASMAYGEEAVGTVEKRLECDRGE